MQCTGETRWDIIIRDTPLVMPRHLRIGLGYDCSQCTKTAKPCKFPAQPKPLETENVGTESGAWRGRAGGEGVEGVRLPENNLFQ